MKRTLYQFLLLLLLLTGCNDPKPVTDALTRAEALMNEYPDSAWAVLTPFLPMKWGKTAPVPTMPCSIPRRRTRPIATKPTTR